MIVSSGIACGVLLGVIEGVGVLMQRMFAEGNRRFYLSVYIHSEAESLLYRRSCGTYGMQRSPICV